SSSSSSSGGGSNVCPTSGLLGWASVSGHGVELTTGGGNTAPVLVTTAAELQQAASDPQPRVIQFAGTISLPELKLTSNKTIEGMGPGATLIGGIRIRGTSTDPSK